jgi:hypothetical protein
MEPLTVERLVNLFEQARENFRWRAALLELDAGKAKAGVFILSDVEMREILEATRGRNTAPARTLHKLAKLALRA